MELLHLADESLQLSSEPLGNFALVPSCWVSLLERLFLFILQDLFFTQRVVLEGLGGFSGVDRSSEDVVQAKLPRKHVLHMVNCVVDVVWIRIPIQDVCWSLGGTCGGSMDLTNVT